MKELVWLIYFAQDETAHFAASSLAALLGFCAMWIISFVLASLMGYGTRRNMPTAAVYGMVAISLLAGLGCALLAHCALDGLSVWLTTPLGPPLMIER